MNRGRMAVLERPPVTPEPLPVLSLPTVECPCAHVSWAEQIAREFPDHTMEDHALAVVMEETPSGNVKDWTVAEIFEFYDDPRRRLLEDCRECRAAFNTIMQKKLEEMVEKIRKDVFPHNKL